MKRRYWGDKGSPGPERERAVAKVEDLMVRQVITLSRHQTVGHARELMRGHNIHSIPVVDAGGEPVGIVTSSDFVARIADETLIGQVMTTEVQTVSPYAGPHLAARLMRSQHIHHLVVTHEQKVVGVISSFDLLRLVEDKRFTVKNLPTAPKKASWEKRKKREETGE